MQSLLFAAALLVSPQPQDLPDLGVTVVDRPPTDVRNPHYPTNRPPLRATPLLTLPIGTVDPRGWLREMRLCYGDDFMPQACNRQRYGPDDDVDVRIWRGL